MAAYGLVQLDKLADFNARRQHNFRVLDDAMANHGDVVLRPRMMPEADTTWMRYCFVLADGVDRTDVQQRLGERKIATRMVWTGNILRQPGFAAIPHRAPADGLPNADRITEQALSLPNHNGLTSDDLGYLIEVIDEVFANA
jgi:CDP-6-deoxy-D-xylo-4-hexulose-3-dehydrase